MRESIAPVDRTARESAASVIEDSLDGKIDNDELERAIFAPQVQADATCREIALELSFYYSDFAQHKNQGKYRIPDKMERTIRRWVCFLGPIGNGLRVGKTRHLAVAGMHCQHILKTDSAIQA